MRQHDKPTASAHAGETLTIQTPYELTLAGLKTPLAVLFAFNILAAVSLAFFGAAELGAIMAAIGCLADVAVQRLYARWIATAPQMDSDTGLRRLAVITGLRNCLWFVAPLALALETRSVQGVVAVMIPMIGTIATGCAAGWSSRAVFTAMVSPGLVALAVVAVAILPNGPMVGALIGLGVSALTLGFIAIATHLAVSQWSQASERTVTALAEVQSAEKRLRIATELADLYVYEVDYVNRTLYSLGAEKTFYEVPLTYEQMWDDPYVGVADEDRERVIAAWRAYEETGVPYRAEYRVKRGDGREIWASAFAEIRRDETGRALKLVGALQDISAHKANERALIEARDQAEGANQAKSEFLATMSHEIRTPLNGVLGMAQVMERDALAPVQRQRVEVIRKSGEILLSLLNSLLDLSKIEAGKLELEIHEFDIAEIALRASEPFQALASQKGVRLSIDIRPEARGVYRGDGTRVGQILSNLVSNAVKFTDEGQIDVRIGRSGDALELLVADTGSGVTPDQKARLFEKFVQADASTTRRFGGSGLGLAIIRELAALMGGGVSLDSAPGHGSTFRVRLPLDRLRDAQTPGKAEAVAPPAPAPHEVDADAGASGLRVLAAEDNAVNQLVLKTLLQQVGIEPVLVADGRQALEAWEAGEWDLILMDMQMPNMDGLTATRLIREREAAMGRRPTRIVALTANLMPHQIASYRAAGMDEVVGKPIEVGALLNAVDASLAAA